jgi:hypothetical protein
MGIHGCCFRLADVGSALASSLVEYNVWPSRILNYEYQSETIPLTGPDVSHANGKGFLDFELFRKIFHPTTILGITMPVPKTLPRLRKFRAEWSRRKTLQERFDDSR